MISKAPAPALLASRTPSLLTTRMTPRLSACRHSEHCDCQSILQTKSGLLCCSGLKVLKFEAAARIDDEDGRTFRNEPRLPNSGQRRISVSRGNRKGVL